MSAPTTTSAAPRDVEHNPAKNNTPARETVLITEQEVLFGTRAATAPRRLPLSRRLIGAVRSATASLRLPPPHQHYPADMGYLEQSRMAREMDRL